MASELKATEADFRKAGMTADAINYPRPPKAVIALKRFNGLADDAPVPPAWHYFPNAWMRDNWEAEYDLWNRRKGDDDGQ